MKIVVKLGGNVLGGNKSLADDIKQLVADGHNIAIIHGGGSLIDQALNSAGIAPKRIDGLRVTDAATMAIVTGVLDKVNAELAGELQLAGVTAVPLQSQQIILHGKVLPQLGLVGTVQSVDSEPLTSAFGAGSVPVIAPFGTSSQGVALNINADDAAVAVAVALKADKLLYLSDIPGVLADAADRGSLIPQLTVAQCADLLQTSVASGGMVPKLHTAMAAIKGGVGSVNILDGLAPHALRRACDPSELVGTVIVP